jgi:preprotein translocase subunit SecB
MNDPKQIQVGVARIYVKDISFESPKSPQIFSQQIQPELKVDVSVKPRAVQENLWEVALTLTVEAKTANEPAFLIEVVQCGIFDVRNASQPELERVLGIFCPTTLFPYARQAIDSLLSLGSFPPLMLAPINFEMMQRSAAEQRNQVKN